MSDVTVSPPPATQTGPPEVPEKTPEKEPAVENTPTLPLRRRLSPYLTRIAHGATPFISTFLMVHLASPSLASIGGSSLASQVMLLGREYYQTYFGEYYLLLLPLDVHVLASMSKRLLSFAHPKTPATKTPRPITSLLSMTGYPLFFFLRLHYHIHRVFPKDPLPPIDALGPAELDYEFVKYGLQQWPLRSWLLYGGLTLFTAWHVSEGLQIIYNTWFRGKGQTRGGDTESQAVTEKPRLKLTRKSRLIGATLVTVPAFVGLWVVASEPVMAFSSFASRYHAIFTKTPVYRI